MKLTGQTTKGSVDSQQGAALVEFAVVAILLFTLLFGIIEAGWGFNQQLEVRHGAREGARLAATAYGTDAAITAEVCNRMHFSGDNTATTVTITKTGSDIGSTVAVTVSTSYAGLTGFLDEVFGGAVIDSTVESRLEQIADGTLGTGAANSCT
jgi:Flp pilus assembly protein TadG